MADRPDSLRAFLGSKVFERVGPMTRFTLAQFLNTWRKVKLPRARTTTKGSPLSSNCILVQSLFSAVYYDPGFGTGRKVVTVQRSHNVVTIQRSQNTNTIPRKYQGVLERTTNYRFGIHIFWVGIPTTFFVTD